VSTILIADDNSNIQKMVTLALKDQGIDVIAVGNGEAAVRKMRDMVPDLVLADIFMPVRSGYEVCEFVKQDPRLAHVPVILLTGAFDPFDQAEAERVGANGVLKKPFVPPDPLINLVKSLLPKVPEPVEVGSGDFVSNKVPSTDGPRVAASTFFPVPPMPPPPAPRPRAESSVAVAAPPETIMAKAPRVEAVEEFPEIDEEVPYAEQMRPAALDQILANVKPEGATEEADHAFGGVAAFPGLVDNEAPPREPQKEPWSIRPPSTKDMVEHYWPPRSVSVEEETEPAPTFRPSAFDTPQSGESASGVAEVAEEKVEEFSAAIAAPFAPIADESHSNGDSNHAEAATGVIENAAIETPVVEEALAENAGVAASTEIETSEEPTEHAESSEAQHQPAITQQEWASFSSVAGESSTQVSIPEPESAMPRPDVINIEEASHELAADSAAAHSETAEPAATDETAAKSETPAGTTTSFASHYGLAFVPEAPMDSSHMEEVPGSFAPGDFGAHDSENNNANGAAHDAPLAVRPDAAELDSVHADLVAEISDRVMERMRPQVMEIITREILRPIVEALVRKEVENR
jgi:CheY-like chemotaxis protein